MDTVILQEATGDESNPFLVPIAPQSESTEGPLLETGQLMRRFGGFNAVDGVDFKLSSGEIRAIIGPNGAGKTTFVSLLCGRIQPTQGFIRFKGDEVTRMSANRRVDRGIAYTFQITNVFQSLTVFDNIMLAAQSEMRRRGGMFARLDQEELEMRVLIAMSALGLEQFSGRKACELSYGHQRLLEVAMGIALQPALLILDEPTQGLSDVEIEEFISLMRKVAETTTLLLIEHNMHVVMQLAHRITVMNRGRILAEGTPDDIRGNADVQAAYLAA